MFYTIFFRCENRRLEKESFPKIFPVQLAFTRIFYQFPVGRWNNFFSIFTLLLGFFIYSFLFSRITYHIKEICIFQIDRRTKKRNLYFPQFSIVQRDTMIIMQLLQVELNIVIHYYHFHRKLIIISRPLFVNQYILFDSSKN